VWLYASRGYRIVDHRLDAGYLRRLTLQYIGSVALYLGAAVISLIDFMGFGNLRRVDAPLFAPAKEPRLSSRDTLNRSFWRG